MSLHFCLVHLPSLPITPLTGFCNLEEQLREPPLDRSLRLTDLPIQPHCLLSQMTAASYQTDAPSGLHKKLPRGSPCVTCLHWPEEPIRAAQSVLSLVLCPACLEAMGKCFQLLQTGLVFSFRNLNALLGFLLSASLSV